MSYQSGISLSLSFGCGPAIIQLKDVVDDIEDKCEHWCSWSSSSLWRPQRPFSWKDGDTDDDHNNMFLMMMVMMNMNVNIGGGVLGGLDSLMTHPTPWRPFTNPGMAFTKMES